MIVGFVLEPSTVRKKQEDQDEQSFKVYVKIINKIKNFFQFLYLFLPFHFFMN